MSLPCRFFGLAALTVGMASLPGQADVVILKDGYAIHGKVGTESSVIFDKLSGDAVVTQKLGGLNLIDDGPRLNAFSAHYKRVGDVDPQNKFAGLIQFSRPIQFRKSSYPLPPVLDLKEKGEFNEKWQRLLKYNNPLQPQNPYRIEQQIDIMTPHYMRVTSYTHQWASYYLTREFGSDLVRKLLSTHPELDERGGKPDADKRAKLIRFLIQADWIDEAEEEVERLAKDLPTEKRVDEFRDSLRDLRLDKAVADIERAKEAGQHQRAQRIMRGLPKELPAKASLRIATLRAEYDSLNTKMQKAQSHLTELEGLVDAAKFAELVTAAKTVREELHIDSVQRLDLFLTLADQAANARKAGKPPQHAPEQLLAAGVCGWLMGNTTTEAKVDTAAKRLTARQVALAYLRQPNSAKRREALLDYVSKPEALPFDELEKLISLLPPPEAEKDTSAEPGLKKTGPLPELIRGAGYLLKLPPEYHHSRSYPLLIILPHGSDTPTKALQRFGNLPAEYGFITAVLDWTAAFDTNYTGAPEQHAMLTGLIRHLRRTLQVDSDRVFLFGDSEGANFAMDVAATHPDLFAGVIPMTPNPDFQSFRVFGYWKNYQNLPVYMIVGDRAGEAVKTIRDILTNWMPRGYPALAVSYKGRGVEYFQEELPYAFDWMSRKTRANAFPELGRASEEFRTVRANSRHFYWISSDEVDPRCLFDPNRRTVQISPAIVQARFSEGNQITVTEMGFKQLSIWLGRNTVDFGKPVNVTIKNRGNPWRKELTPKITVLLEDLYERGDRQRPFYQRIDCTNLDGQVKFAAQ